MKTALTIGFFDGVHLGHLALLHALRKHPHTTILTFSNHPQEILSSPGPKMLLSIEEKLKLLSPFADKLLSIPFTQEFAKTSYDELLDQFDLSHLLLGEGAKFGKDLEGDEKNVRAYCEKRNISIEYFPKVLFENQVISSSRIREAIENNQFQLASQLLGRPL